MTRPINCICENCSCKSDCDFYKETIEPCLEVVRVNLNDDSEPFIGCLMRNLDDFECEYFEGAKAEEADPKVEALQLIDEIKACLYNIEDFGEQGGYIDEPVLDYVDTLSEKVRELECKVTAI